MDFNRYCRRVSSGVQKSEAGKVTAALRDVRKHQPGLSVTCDWGCCAGRSFGGGDFDISTDAGRIRGLQL